MWPKFIASAPHACLASFYKSTFPRSGRKYCVYLKLEEESGVPEVDKVRSWALVSLMKQVRTSVLNRPAKETYKLYSVGGRELVNVSTLRRRAKRSSAPKFIFGDLIWGSGLNRWQEICMTKQSWSKCGSSHHSCPCSCLFYKVSGLCGLWNFFLGDMLTLYWAQCFSLFLPPANSFSISISWGLLFNSLKPDERTHMSL